MAKGFSVSADNLYMTKTAEQKKLKAYLETAKGSWTRGHLEAMVRGSSKAKK